MYFKDKFLFVHGNFMFHSVAYSWDYYTTRVIYTITLGVSLLYF